MRRGVERGGRSLCVDVDVNHENCTTVANLAKATH